MANIDDLLDGPPVTEDVNEAYYINPITRKIEIPADELILGVNHDEKGECKFFRIPKVIGNDVRVMDCDVRIYFQTAANNEQDCYVVKELIEQADCVVFYWEISSKVTGLPGEVLFSVGITKSIDGVIEKAWNTVCATATVLDTLHSDLMPGPPAEKIDVIARIEAISDEANAYKEAAQLSAAEAASHAGQAASDADRAFAASVTAAERAADATSAAAAAQTVVDGIVPEVNQLKDDLLYFGSIDVPGAETLITGNMVLATGKLLSQESSDAHTGIRVTRGTRIEIANAYCAYSRSICAYDQDGAFVKTLATNLGENRVTVEFDVDDYDYVSVTSKTGESITVRYISGQTAIPNEGFANRIDEKNATKDGTGNYIAVQEIQLDQSTFTDGYLAEKNVVNHSSYYYSDYIPVIEEQNIKLNNIFVGGFTVAVFYDSDKKYLTHISHASTSVEISTTITVPYNAKYMRFTANKSRDFSTIRVAYTDKIERNFKPLNLVNRWYYDSKGRINTLFAKATSKPICCIIDDDSPSATYMEIFAALMEENGISGTIACVTKVMDENEDLKTKLLELERRGHQVVLHGYTQNEAYKNASVIGDANYKVAENDFVHGLRDLMAAGFVDCKFWVSPYGVSQECMKNLARKWGMECLITSAKKDYNGSDGKFSRYEIQRSGLNADDTGTLTQEQLLALADQCADANGWLLINTHISAGWNGDFTRITDFITHCKEKGFEFMTLGDAWRIRKPIYEWYETF